MPPQLLPTRRTHARRRATAPELGGRAAIGHWRGQLTYMRADAFYDPISGEYSARATDWPLPDACVQVELSRAGSSGAAALPGSRTPNSVVMNNGTLRELMQGPPVYRASGAPLADANGQRGPDQRRSFKLPVSEFTHLAGPASPRPLSCSSSRLRNGNCFA